MIRTNFSKRYKDFNVKVNPIEVKIKQDSEEFTVDRKFDCKYHPVCLELACDWNWQSFACTKCEVYESMNLTDKIEQGLVSLAMYSKTDKAE